MHRIWSLPSRERELKLPSAMNEAVSAASLPSRERELKLLAASIDVSAYGRSPRGSAN